MEEQTQPTEEQKTVMKAKLDEMKMKRAGKISHNAKVEAVPQQPVRPEGEIISKTIQEFMQKIKDLGFQADQIFHAGAEMQLFATNEMILNGLTNFGSNVEKYVQKEYVKKEKYDELRAKNEIISEIIGENMNKMLGMIKELQAEKIKVVKT